MNRTETKSSHKVYDVAQLIPSNLQNMKADTGSDRAVVGMWLLVRMHVKQADSSESFQTAFLAEDQ